MAPLSRLSGPYPMGPARPAADLLLEARSRERAGCIQEAMEGYDAAIRAAEKSGEHSVLAEALRRLAIVRHQRGELSEGRELGRRSHEVALDINNVLLAAEALNTTGGMDLTTGSLADARQSFQQALELGGQNGELRARAEQNLGIVANIQGELDEAQTHYRRSL